MKPYSDSARSVKINAFVDEETKDKLVKLAKGKSQAQAITELIAKAFDSTNEEELKSLLVKIDSKLDTVIALLAKQQSQG